MATKHFVPRWRHQQVTIPALGTIPTDPVPFSNTEIWPWHLHWLALVGEPNIALASAPYDTVGGGLGARLLLQASISQWSTINLVPVLGGAMMPHLRNPLTMPPWAPFGQRFQFPEAAVLSPDESIVAEVQNNGPAGASGFSLVFNGYRHREDGSREPEQLAGIYEDDLDPGVSDTLDSGDLYNDGESDVHLHEMILDTGHIIQGAPSNSFGTKSSWRINPATGVQWMDLAGLIPEGGICPFNRPGFALLDEGPRAYEFPAGTILRRRQRLTLDIDNLSDVAQTANLVLFGLLEVS